MYGGMLARVKLLPVESNSTYRQQQGVLLGGV